jgi:hypothetical protein
VLDRSAAARRRRGRASISLKRVSLNPCDYLAIASYLVRPLEMATTVERPFVRLLTLSRDAGHTTNTIFEPNLCQLLAKEVAYGWRHRFR